MADVYTIVFLNPKTGDRIVIDGVEAEIETKTAFESAIVGDSFNASKRVRKSAKPVTTLDVKLEIRNPTLEQYEQMTDMLMNKNLYLHFHDVHPNLINGYIRSIIMNQDVATIEFDGSIIDKTYVDYLTEIATQVNNKIFHVISEPEHDLTQPNDPIDDGIVDPGFKKKVKFKKRKAIQALKRKLTF